VDGTAGQGRAEEGKGRGGEEERGGRRGRDEGIIVLQDCQLRTLNPPLLYCMQWHTQKGLEG